MSNNEFNHEPVAPVSREQRVNEIFEQITKITSQTEYLHEAFQTIATIGTESQSIVEMIREREATSRQALNLLEKMYNELKPVSYNQLTDEFEHEQMAKLNIKFEVLKRLKENGYDADELVESIIESVSN